MDIFFLKKTVTAFLLPPGIFILLLCISGILLITHKRRKAGIFNIATGGLLWIAALSPVGNRLMANIEQGQNIPVEIQGDVIILLGGGIYPYARDFTGTGVPSEDMLSRVVTAVRAQKRLHLPILVSGGAIAGRTPEAVVVRRFLLDLGVPAEKILVEDKSRDTTENARYCRSICSRHGFRRPLLITSGYHMRRSVFAFGREGMKVAPLPAFLRSSTTATNYLFIDFMPNADALATTSAVLRERIGLLFYKLGGK